MDYYLSFNVHIASETVPIKAIKTDETAVLPKAALAKLRQMSPQSSTAKTMCAEDIVAVLNIKTCRLVKMSGKVWDNISAGDEVWLLTAKEWKEHSENVLIHQCKVRHGKTLIIRNPAALSAKQVFEMVDAYYPDIEKKFTEAVSPASSPAVKPRAVSSAPPKKPFLKAYAGSPYRPPVPYSEKRRQAALAAGGGGTPGEAGADGGALKGASPSPTKPARTPSPQRNSSGRGAGTLASNREQTVYAKLSPTLLRRVGLGRHLGSPQDTSLLTTSEAGAQPHDADNSTAEEVRNSAEQGSPEQKVDNPTGPDVFSEINEAEEDDEQFEFSVHHEEGDSAQYDPDGSGEGADDVMLGAGDDGTLTTVTNSVIDSFSFQDHSISPRSSGRYDAHSYAGTATVLGAEFEPLAAGDDETAESAVHGHEPGMGAGTGGVADASSVGSSYEEEEASPLYEDIVAQGLSSSGGSRSGSRHSDDDSAVSSLAHPPPPSNSHAEYDENGELRRDALQEGGTVSPTLSESGSRQNNAAPADPIVAPDMKLSSATSPDALSVTSSVASAESLPAAALAQTSCVQISHFEASLGGASSRPGWSAQDFGDSALMLGSVDLGEHFNTLSSGGPMEDRPPLRWQLTEEENFCLGTPNDAIQHATPSEAGLPAETEVLGSYDLGYQFEAPSDDFGLEDRPPLRWQLTEEENFSLDTPTAPLEVTAPTEEPVSVEPERMDEPESIAASGAVAMTMADDVDSTSGSAECLTAGSQTFPLVTEIIVDDKNVAQETEQEEPEEPTALSEASTDQSVAEPALAHLEEQSESEASLLGHESEAEDVQAEQNAEEGGSVSGAASADLSSPLQPHAADGGFGAALSSPTKTEVRDPTEKAVLRTPESTHERDRLAHYSQLGSACIVGENPLSRSGRRGSFQRGESLRGSAQEATPSSAQDHSALRPEPECSTAESAGAAEAEAVSVPMAAVSDTGAGDVDTQSAVADSADAQGSVGSGSPVLMSEPVAPGSDVESESHSGDADGGAALPLPLPAEATTEDEASSMDLAFSTDNVLAGATRRELFPLYLSSSLDNTEGDGAADRRMSTEVYTMPGGSEGVAELLSSSGSVVGASIEEEALLGESGDEYRARSPVSAGLDVQTTFPDAESCQEGQEGKVLMAPVAPSPLSPLLGSSSEMIALSPDREMESSSRFIRRPEPASSVEGSESASDEADRNDASEAGEADGSNVEEPPSPSSSPVRDADTQFAASASAEAAAENVAVEFNSKVPTSTDILAVSAVVPAVPTTVAVPTARPEPATDLTRELQDRVRRQAEELAEASRTKAALEARLDETRQLLQIFAAGRNAFPAYGEGSGRNRVGSGGGADSSTLVGDVDLDVLESTLQCVSVESVPFSSEASPDASSYSLPRDSPTQSGNTSSGSTMKMRKSLRKLLERKREEKQLRGESQRPPMAEDSGLRPGRVPSSSSGTGKTAVRAVRSKPKADNESSDSALSSSETTAFQRRGIRNTASTDSVGLPIPGYGIRKDPRLYHLRSQSDGSAGIAESIDELEMTVTAVHSALSSASQQTNHSNGSSGRATPTVVSLELGEIFSSNSSDPITPRDSLRISPGIDPLLEPAAPTSSSTANSLSPPPPPPATLPTLPPAAGATSPEIPHRVALSPERAKLPASLTNLTITLEDLPVNLHIVSPRHLTVEVSSSSSSSESSVANGGSAQPVAASEAATTFSPASSGSKASAFFPRQIGVTSPGQQNPMQDQDGTSPSKEAPLDWPEGSDDLSSVDSDNPLLLESTPKIRGLARRAAHNQLLQQHHAGIAATSGVAPAGSVSASGVDAHVVSLHEHFFPKDIPATVLAPVAHDPLETSETTFLYQYDAYHKLRPDLFLDSGPNSPFNPHSVFMHPTHVSKAGGRGGVLGAEENDGSEDLHLSYANRLAQPRTRTLTETELNTAANSSLHWAKEAPAARTAATATHVSFSPSNIEFPSDAYPTGESEAGVQVVPDPADTLEPGAPLSPAPAPPAAAAAALPSPPPSPPLQQASVEAPAHTADGSISETIDADQPAPEISSNSPDTAAEAEATETTVTDKPALHVDVDMVDDGSVQGEPVVPYDRGDKLLPLLSYSLPFLMTERYLACPALRGTAGRHELQRCTGLRDNISWCVFQLYGTPDGAMVKGIKMIQVVRALKDAEVCTSITTSQLDLLLTKIHVNAKGAAQNTTPTAAVLSSASSNLQSTVLGSRVLRRTAAGQSAGAAGATAGAVAHSAGSNSTKGEQNSNSLAGASFPTFCALLSAIAGIIYSTDPKIRVRVIKKGVTLGDLSHYYTTALPEREAANEKLATMWRALLERRDHREAQRMLQESQISVSGLLLRVGAYRRCPQLPATGTPSTVSAESGCWSPQLVRTFPDADLELIKQVWDRNADQIRQIYGFYAMSKEPRRQGSGPSKLLVGFEHCREALVDFQVLPHVVDAQGYARLFKVVKLWELQVAESLLAAQEGHGGAGSGAVAMTPLTGASPCFPGVSAAAVDALNTSVDSTGMRMMSSSHAMSPGAGAGAFDAQSVSVAATGTAAGASSSDPLDFRGAVGNLALSLTGFLELLTRIALSQQKLGVRPHEALENLMHIMDASEGKAKLIKASRKSTSVRHFVYGVK